MKRLIEKNPNSIEHWNSVFNSEIENNIDRISLDRFQLILSEIKDNTKILDIGCGKGEFIKYLDKYKFNMKLFGCDISDVAIAYCKNKFSKKSNFVACNIDNELRDYKEKGFDYIVCEEVIEHIENPEKLIKDIGYLLKDFGKLILTTPYNNSIVGEHVWSFNVKDITDLLENEDWEIEKIIRYYNFKNLFITAIKK